jgi:hypothetical protein
MGEVFLFIALLIILIYIVAYIIDYINANKIINNRKNNYLSLADFLKIINMSHFNKEKRFNNYLELLDPISKLILESIGLDPNIFKTYKETKLFHQKLIYYCHEKAKVKLDKNQMLNYFNSEDFDTITIWIEYPKSVLPHILNLPDYDEINPLTNIELDNVKELLKDENTLKCIISNCEFKKQINKLIDSAEYLKNNSNDSGEINYLDLKITIYKLALDSAYEKDRISKTEIIKAYEKNYR